MLKFLKRKPQSSLSDFSHGSHAASSFSETIGTTAGKVWTLLDQSGEMKMGVLIKQTAATRDEVMQALGWLAREGKIRSTGKGKSRLIALIDSDAHCRAA